MNRNMVLKGKVWKFGDEIDTDLILPARYLELPLKEYVKHMMDPVRPGFNQLVTGGDIIFAGEKFGIGSSRGQAVAGLKEMGIKAIVAVSVGRIYFRSAINEGLPVIESREAYEQTEEGDMVSVDISLGIIKNESKKTEFHIHQFPDLILDIIKCGGGVNYYKQFGRRKTGSKS